MNNFRTHLTFQARCIEVLKTEAFWKITVKGEEHQFLRPLTQEEQKRVIASGILPKRQFVWPAPPFLASNLQRTLKFVVKVIEVSEYSTGVVLVCLTTDNSNSSLLEGETLLFPIES